MNEWATWITIGLLVVNTILQGQRWISSREHADTDVAKDLARVENDVIQVRKNHHTLANEMQAERVKLAVLDSRVTNLERER